MLTAAHLRLRAHRHPAPRPQIFYTFLALGLLWLAIELVN